MDDKTTIGPSQVEIEHTTAGPIIHIFPDSEDPYVMVENLMKGIFYLHARELDYDGLNRLLKCSKNDLQKKFLSELIKKNLKRTEDANDYAHTFVKKMKFK